MGLKEILSMAGTLALMLAVFAGAYFVSKLVGKKYSTLSNTAKNLSVISTLSIGKDKSLLVIKAADKAFLIGVTERQITTLCELDPKDFPEPAEEKPHTKDFRSTLKDVISGAGRMGKGDKD
ncbi:MAG: flagellar biosynthetic protein FliO [Clostridiales bacterium]|nr:flagellar biosynthetic protein FliO [Clostridiales bacterium]